MTVYRGLGCSCEQGLVVSAVLGLDSGTVYEIVGETPHYSRIRLGASVGSSNASNVQEPHEMGIVVEAVTVSSHSLNIPVSCWTLRDPRDATQDAGLRRCAQRPIRELYAASIYPQVRTLAVNMVKRAVDSAVQNGAVHHRSLSYQAKNARLPR